MQESEVDVSRVGSTLQAVFRRSLALDESRPGMRFLSMNEINALLAAPGASVAVVGATDNLRKYGAKIYRDLKRKGYEVFAVNLYRGMVDGDPAYPTLADLPEAPTVVNFVVPPEETLEVLEQALDLGYTAVWVQPGAESTRVLEYLRDNPFNYVTNACIMVDAPIPSM